jgi:hypothetical protein
MSGRSSALGMTSQPARRCRLVAVASRVLIVERDNAEVWLVRAGRPRRLDDEWRARASGWALASETCEAIEVTAICSSPPHCCFAGASTGLATWRTPWPPRCGAELAGPPSGQLLAPLAPMAQPLTTPATLSGPSDLAPNPARGTGRPAVGGQVELDAATEAPCVSGSGREDHYLRAVEAPMIEHTFMYRPVAPFRAMRSNPTTPSASAGRIVMLTPGNSPASNGSKPHARGAPAPRASGPAPPRGRRAAPGRPRRPRRRLTLDGSACPWSGGSH